MRRNTITFCSCASNSIDILCLRLSSVHLWLGLAQRSRDRRRHRREMHPGFLVRHFQPIIIAGVTMTQASAITANRANYVTADHCGHRRRALRLNQSVMQTSRAVFPVKTAHHLADITGYSLRTVEYWLSEKSVISADALTALLHSEWGRDFLSAVMSDATPKWWLRLKAWIASVDLAAAEAKQRRKLRELLDDVASRPSASLLVSDPDFYSGQPYPTRTLDPKRSRAKRLT